MEILILHGLFGSLSDPSIIGAFQAEQVHAPDLLGYGESRDYPTEDLTLAQQAAHVAQYLNGKAAGPVHVVGHSVGGAVGLLLAAEYPSLVKSYTSVEGNMTLKDAFWSEQISTKPIADIQLLIEGYQSDVAAWIEGAGVIADEEKIKIATNWLNNQPASTIRAQANAVVNATKVDEYLANFEILHGAKIPVNLMAGEASFAGWDVPNSVKEKSASLTIIKGRGHLMMLEDPQEFACEVLSVLGRTSDSA